MKTIDSEQLKETIIAYGLLNNGIKNKSKSTSLGTVVDLNAREHLPISIRKLLKYQLDNSPQFQELYNGTRKYEDESRNDMSFIWWLKYFCKFDLATSFAVATNSPYFKTKDMEHQTKFRDRQDYFRRTYDNTEENLDGEDCSILNNVLENTTIDSIIRPISSVDEVKDVDWLIPYFLSRGYTSVLFSEAGVGKTWIVIDLGINISLGLPVLGDVIVDKQKVLLFEGDAPDTLIKERINKLPNKSDDNYFQYVNCYEAEKKGITLNLSEQVGLNNFEEIIKTSRPDLIIVDTLISVINDEKDPENVRHVIKSLNSFANKYECGILLCHHTRKRLSGEKRNKTDQSDVIGTSIITRLASCVIGIDKYHSNLVISTKKSWFQKLPEKEMKIIDTEDGKVKIEFTPHDSNEKNATDKMCDKILDYIISKNVNEFKRKDIEQQFNNVNSVRKALKKMEDNGLIASYGTTRNKVFYIINNQPNMPQTQWGQENDLDDLNQPN